MFAVKIDSMLSVEKPVKGLLLSCLPLQSWHNCVFQKLHLLHLAEHTDTSECLLCMPSPYLTLLVLFPFNLFGYLRTSAEMTE